MDVSKAGYKAGAYPGGSGPPPKKFEPQREHGSKFFEGGSDPPGTPMI